MTRIFVTSDPAYNGDTACTLIWQENDDGTISLLQTVYAEARHRTRLIVQWHIIGLYLLAAGFAYTIARLLDVPWYGILGMELMTVAATVACIREWKR